MTDRLYYTDSYLREWSARIVETAGEGRRVYLDRTAFYPASGGQPFDTGTLGGARVVEVVDEGERIAHVTDTAVEPGMVECRVDWERRFDHMQQHSGQHLLSAVIVELWGVQTVSFHLGQESATIDLATPALEPQVVEQAERRANQVVFENRPLEVGFQEAAEATDLRKPSEREGTLRIVSIDGLDRSACGGTHVRATGEIGPILIRRLDKVRNTVRMEFLCGARALRRARADYQALARTAQLFSAALDETPAAVATQLEEARNAEKQRRKLETELARYQGRELWEATTADAAGLRRVTRRLASGSLEDLRPLAQSFTAQSKAVFLAAVQAPPAVLLAASADAGVDAGKLVKAAVSQAGGRGGGNARIAQGSVPGAAELETVLQQLGAAERG